MKRREKCSFKGSERNSSCRCAGTTCAAAIDVVRSSTFRMHGIGLLPAPPLVRLTAKTAVRSSRAMRLSAARLYKYRLVSCIVRTPVRPLKTISYNIGSSRGSEGRSAGHRISPAIANLPTLSLSPRLPPLRQHPIHRLRDLARRREIRCEVLHGARAVMRTVELEPHPLESRHRVRQPLLGSVAGIDEFLGCGVPLIG